MATFSEWLVFEQIREEVYEKSIQRLHTKETLHNVLEFCNMAVNGRWELILENYDEDEDSFPDYDPFADGDENASEVKLPSSSPNISKIRKKKKKRRRNSSLAPHELRASYTGWNPPKEEDYPDYSPDDQDSDSENSKSELIEKAKEIQRLWYMARLGAMLDRRDLISRVKEIYEKEFEPLFSQNEWLRLEDLNDDDDWGNSYFIDSSPKGNVTATAAPSTDPDREIKIKKVAERLRPLLEKLGYLKDSHMPEKFTDYEIVQKIIEKAKIAKDEKGNDPPDNEQVREMESNPMIRRKQYSDVMEKLSKIIVATARAAFNRTTSNVQDSEGRIKKGSRFLEDDFLNDGILRAMKTITMRKVLQDGTAEPWDDTTNAFIIKIEDEESAKRYLNSLKSSIKRGSIKRDADREDRKSAGINPSSEATPTSIDASVAGSDGDSTTIGAGVSDPRGRDSLSLSVAEESRKTLVNAFRQAMIELRDSKPNGPSLAVLACLWMQLDCADDGSVPDGNISRFFSAAAGVASGSSQSAKSFIDKLALDQHIPGTPKQKSELGEWALVRLIASKRTEFQNMPRMDRMPPGIPSERPPSVEGKSAYASRHLMGDSDKLWYAYQKKIADAKRDAIYFLTNRMQQIMAENDPSLKPKGWRSPCSWNLFKFLKDTYRDALGKTVIIGDRESNPLTVTFFNKHKKSQKIREYSLSIRGEFINITQTYPTGYETQNFRYEIPQNSIKCDTCMGAGRDCPECEGCGSTMDRVKTINLEKNIKERLDLQRRSRSKKS